MKKKLYIILCTINSIIPIIDLYIKIKNNNTFISSLNITEKSENIMFPIYSTFSLWMCGINESKYTAIFFYVNLAIVIISCYIFTYKRNEKITADNIKKSKYYIGTYSKVFLLCGGLTVFPLILNFVGMSMFMSSIHPDSVYDIFYGIFSDNVFGDIFYQYPFLYLLIYIAAVFIFWGSVGCIGFGLTTITKFKLFPLLLESSIVLMLHYKQHYSEHKSIFSPLSIFDSYKCMYSNYTVVFIELSAVLVLAAVLFGYSYKNNRLINET